MDKRELVEESYSGRRGVGGYGISLLYNIV